MVHEEMRLKLDWEQLSTYDIVDSCEMHRKDLQIHIDI